MNLKSIYPVCIGGIIIAPSEVYNSLIDFIEKQPSKFIDVMDSLDVWRQLEFPFLHHFFSL